jgi:hypothetical protein
MMATLIKAYKAGKITRYQIMMECLHMIDPQHPELVLEPLPPEVHDEILDYASRYDPKKPAPKERLVLMPAADQVDAARSWITKLRSP